MFGKILSRLFSHQPTPVVEYESFEYKGFTVTPMPEPADGSFHTAGRISKIIDSEEKSVKFIRADRHPTPEQAEQHAQVKARQIIDEQGDRIFNSSHV